MQICVCVSYNDFCNSKSKIDADSIQSLGWL